ncbi:MAG: KAP family P-loop NTPase fold protein [Candidatus Saccharimonadales bacterium]
MAKLDFNFIKDEPAGKNNGGTFDFYHNSIAPALAKILKDKSSPHTVGLFGSWGTGKSTIIELLKDDKTLDAPIFVFDAWKYQQEDSLRRIFLTDLVEFVNNNPEIKCQISLEDLEVQLYRSRAHTITKQVATEKPKLPFWKQVLLFCKKNWFFVGTIAAMITWIALQIFAKNNVYLEAIRDVMKSLAGISFVVLFVKSILGEALKNAVSNLMKEVTLAAELRTSTEYEDRLNSPEQFEKLFKKIIEQVNQKMIIVFDNIDRVQGDVAISMLSTIKTFLDPGNKPGLVFIIPCDAAAIKHQIAKYYESGIAGENFDSSEYLRKVFNLVVWVPEFIGTDLEDYTKKKLSDTGDIQKIINNEDVILVINAAFSRNPREIIQFINNLIAAVLVASETKVWPIISNNIAYLAKVLVLRQKFPSAYALLKERWDEPENIIDIETGKDKESTNNELIDFMSLTNRISTNDAEPFLYFKTPVRSSKLKHSDELRKALTTATNETVSDLIKKEHKNDDVAEFVCDLLKKYKSQPRVLFNIFTSHTTAFETLNARITLKKYYDTTTSIIDKQLWQSHQELPVDYIFSLVGNELTMKKTRVLIIDRYIAVIEAKDSEEEYLVRVFSNLAKISSSLSTSQKTKIRDAIEDKYVSTSIMLQLFKDQDTQNNFISTGALRNYIASMTDVVISNWVETLKQYKDYIVANDVLETLLLKIIEVLTTTNANKPNDIEAKTTISAAINNVMSLYKSETSSLNTTVEKLAEALLATYSQIPTIDERASVANSMYWINHVTSEAASARLNSSVADFIGGASLVALKKMIGYWNEETRQNLVKRNINIILPRLTDPAVLEYLYSNADQPTKVQMLKQIATQQGAADVAFVAQLQELPGKIETLDILLKKAGSISYDQREPYYNFLTSRLGTRDAPELKDTIIAQAKSLLRTDDPQSQKVAYDLITRLKMLNETYKRDIGKDLLEWIKQPGRALAASHQYSLKVLTFIFDSLQTPPQNEIIYLMFNSLSDAYDTQTIRNALTELQTIRPRYLKYAKDYEDVLERLRSFAAEDERRQVILEGLKVLEPKKPGKKEIEYWKKYKQIN